MKDDDENAPLMTADDDEHGLGPSSVTMVEEDAAAEPLDSYEQLTNKFLRMLRENMKQYLDTVYGVHKVNNNMLLIGDTTIRFRDKFIYMRDEQYLEIVDLLELLLRQAQSLT